MRFIKTILLTGFLFILGSQVSFAQDDPEPADQPTEQPTEPTVDEDGRSRVSSAESEAEYQRKALEKQRKEEEKNKPKKKSFWDKLKFWKKKEKPKPAIEYNLKVEALWHENLQRYMGVTDEEFYRNGYARKGVQWYPIFFLRRFKMMQNQYEHTLVVYGRPEKMPRVKGINLGLYGVEVTNEGFDFQMPTVSSVSRSQKKYDDIQALDFATSRLQSFGFEEVLWLKDKKKETKDLADTWSFPTDN